MRVPGLATGMDIDSLVKQLMTAKRAPLDKLNQNKQILEWQRESYRTLNSAVVDFRQNKLGAKYRSASEMNVFSSTVSGNKDAISVKATTTANQVPMEVEVTSLATQTSLESLALSAGTSVRTKLGDLNSTENEFTFSVSRGDGSYTQSFTFTKSDTIQDVLKKLNGDVAASISASFDEASKKIIIKSKEYGNDTVQFDGTLLTKALNADPAKTVAGKAAELTINGTPYTPTSNQLTVNGVQITLLGTNKGDPATITTKPDGQKALETVKAFIEDYNTLIKALNDKTNEQKYRDFRPLSTEEKKEMKEDEIKRWEEKAKSGLLRNDEILVEALGSMRNILVSSTVTLGDSTIGLPSVGITTGPYTENGKLYLDEEKFLKAIDENPDQVLELFVGSSDGSSKGIFDKMYDSLNVTLSRLSDKAGTLKYSTDVSATLNEQSTMGKELRDLNNRISDLTKKLTVMENNYYKQFASMETAINKFNSQSASLLSFSGQ